jgi:hypothetical protein
MVRSLYCSAWKDEREGEKGRETEIENEKEQLRVKKYEREEKGEGETMREKR